MIIDILQLPKNKIVILLENLLSAVKKSVNGDFNSFLMKKEYLKKHKY
ncbi:MAG: hypothetical protein JXR48_03870 [Candidatus Delongbacteria bacterium]|nr:hypothetical protein [Candidatus Delongbacteria bacterium]MBN2834084.1 hypothetical protein [Candidatus Delongbacteria bacterium]